jgi:hypothetical protein
MTDEVVGAWWYAGRRCLRTLLLLVPAVSAGCSGSGQDEAGITGRGGALAAYEPPSVEFCTAIDRIVENQPAAYAALRGVSQAGDQWRGTVVPPGLEDCSIVGTRPGDSQYICWGPSVAGRSELHRLEPVFDSTMSKIDRCMSPQAGAARLTRGPVRSFAGGERVALWRDSISAPGPGLSLRLEENAQTGAYTLSLSALSLR